MGVDNRGCREQEDRRSGISRRKVLAGSLAAIGGSSNLVEKGTAAAFRDEQAASGDVGVGSLNTAIQDQSGYFVGVQYLLSHQLLLDSGFDRIDLTVTNTSTGATTSYGQTETEGIVSHTAGGGPVANDHTYEFTFDCYVDGSTGPVFSETLTDVPNGSDPPDNDDLGGENDPTLEQVTVSDRSTGPYVAYDVSYQVTDADGFDGAVRVRFENTIFFTYGNRTFTNDAVASGSVTYPESEGIYRNWTTFAITVEVVKDNGIVVDSGTLTDDPDGSGTSWSA